MRPYPQKWKKVLRPLFFVVEKYAPTHAHKLIDITPPYLLKKKGGNAPLPTNKNKLGPSFLKKKKWKMCHGLQKESQLHPPMS